MAAFEEEKRKWAEQQAQANGGVAASDADAAKEAQTAALERERRRSFAIRTQVDAGLRAVVAEVIDEEAAASRATCNVAMLIIH